jgi:RNase H-like domain found in reverse transcriptase
LGVVLSHIMPDKTERPIAYGSRSLTKSEANYSQIDKKVTAMFWGLKKYFQYCLLTTRPSRQISIHEKGCQPYQRLVCSTKLNFSLDLITILNTAAAQHKRPL